MAAVGTCPAVVNGGGAIRAFPAAVALVLVAILLVVSAGCHSRAQRRIRASLKAARRGILFYIPHTVDGPSTGLTPLAEWAENTVNSKHFYPGASQAAVHILSTATPKRLRRPRIFYAVAHVHAKPPGGAMVVLWAADSGRASAVRLWSPRDRLGSKIDIDRSDIQSNEIIAAHRVIFNCAVALPTKRGFIRWLLRNGRQVEVQLVWPRGRSEFYPVTVKVWQTGRVEKGNVDN